MNNQHHKQEHIRDAPSGPFFQDGSHSASPPHFREQPGQDSTRGQPGAGASLNRTGTYGVTPSALKTDTASGWGQDLISNIEEVRADTPISNVPSNTRVVPTTVIASDGMNKKDGLPHVIGIAPPGSENTSTSRGDMIKDSQSDDTITGAISATAGNIASGASDAVESVKETAFSALPNTREPTDPSSANQSAPYLQQGVQGKSILPEARKPNDPTAENQSAPFMKQGNLSQGAGTVADTVGSAYDSVASKAAQVLEKAAGAAGDALDSISGDKSSEGVEKSPTHGGIPTSAGPPTS